jgi:hypothetical protein
MTLKEQFSTMVLDVDIANWEHECEKIANKLAFGFLHYVHENCTYVTAYNIDDAGWFFEGGDGPYATSEVLKIYKKEKGL